MSKRTPDTYFSSKKMEKRATAQDRVKSIRASDERTDAKQLKAKLKRKR
jgi:hypothetical protein